MKNEELNQYILHYLTDDKTNSAIMLTGDWGTGKSYYIQHSLKPFLEKDENGKHQCVIVSLYGLNDTAEISKSIYLGTRLKFLNAASEKATTVRFAGKTIVKSVAGFFGVDLSQDEDALQQLYASVDLTGKLIILEDLERSGIDILEVLGYVNSLVEQDGVKILLVANENEIIQYESIVSEKKEPQTLDDQFNQIAHEDEKRLTETAQKYREAKEKTVSDTIIFEGNFGEAAKQIIGAYNSPNLTAIAEADGLTEIITVCRDIGVTNLRTFVFASQKAADIFQIINLDYTEDEDYIKTVFFGILAFSHKMKSGKEIAWSNDNDFSMELGMKKYPLFRSCYNYIRWQAFDADRVDDEKDALNKLRLYDDKTITSDLDLQIIYSWWLHTEAEVLASVEAISVKLNKKESEKGFISLYEYDRLACHLIVIKSLLGCDIEAAKQALVNNLYNKGTEIDPHFLFTSSLAFATNDDVVSEYETLKAEMTASLSALERTIFDFDYQPSSISSLSKTVNDKESYILHNGAFASRLNADKICDMLKRCTAAELQSFRAVFLDVYRSVNIGDFLSADKAAIVELLEKAKKLTEYEGFDKIQILQLNYFIENLTKISAKLR